MHSPTNQIKAFTNQEARNGHTVFHSFSLFPNCLRFLDNLCIIDPIRFEHLDHVIKTDQSESVNFASFIGSKKKKKQIPDFSLSDWPVSGHMIFFFKKIFFYLTLFVCFSTFFSSPPSPLHPSFTPPPLRLGLGTFTSCPLSSTVVHSMCAVLTCYFLRVHCSFLSFTSCPLSSLALFFLYTVHLL